MAVRRQDREAGSDAAWSFKRRLLIGSGLLVTALVCAPLLVLATLRPVQVNGPLHEQIAHDKD